MSAEILYGKTAAERIESRIRCETRELRGRGVVPCLAVVRVGEDAGGTAYVNSIVRRFEPLGIAVRLCELSENASQETLVNIILTLNADETIHGILLLLPLPDGLGANAACAAIAPEKDVDGVSGASMAKVYSGQGIGFVPCTAQAVMELLKSYDIELSGKRVVILGRSLVIGRPLALLMTQADATVTLCHTKTANLPELCRRADIVVAAVGRAELFGREYFSDGQTVIDVGTSWSETKQKTVGDVKFEDVLPIVARLTPASGGVGAVTTAVLASHVLESAENEKNY